MKKTFKFYILIWSICLVIFNTIVFIVPNELIGTNKINGSFWIGYVFITLAFIGQLVCAYFAFKAENVKKLFYKMPLILISYMGLIAMLIVGGLTMAIPSLPNWIGVIVCSLVLGFTAISVIKASAAAEFVPKLNDRVASRTIFIKSLAVETQNLINHTHSPIIKEQCEKVYEVLRYSDPVSNDILLDIEEKLKKEFDLFSEKVKKGDLAEIQNSVKIIIALAVERNNKCKLLK